MIPTRIGLGALALVLLAGCQTMPNGSTMAPPSLTPVGTGLVVQRTEIAAAYAAPERRTFGSLWGGQRQDLFSDLRARKVGDTVTIDIQIDDKAQFDNKTDRSRSSKNAAGIGAALGLSGFGLSAPVAGAADASLDTNASSQTKGNGSIGRSEKLRLSIAGVVTEVLPNGNLMISGSQEIMVNEEVRVLNVAGIVRPIDISAENTIAYDRIAEARITYGGRGRITDAQRPGWGQRVYEGVAPF